MALALHPIVIGQAFRAEYLDQAPAFLTARPWFTTGDEIAAHYQRTADRSALGVRNGHAGPPPSREPASADPASREPARQARPQGGCGPALNGGDSASADRPRRMWPG